MPLLQCKDCTKEFSSDLKRCPGCGAKKQKQMNKAATRWWWYKALLICGFLGALMSQMPNTPISSGSGVSDTDAAPQMCQQFVKEKLHDPDSAEFDSWTRYFHEITKGRVHHVQVTLRAKNGFNALRSMIVDCRVSHVSGDTWRLISLKEFQ